MYILFFIGGKRKGKEKEKEELIFSSVEKEQLIFHLRKRMARRPLSNQPFRRHHRLRLVRK